MKRNIGEEVKFQEWHYGKIVEVNGNLATMKENAKTNFIQLYSLAKKNNILSESLSLETAKKLYPLDPIAASCLTFSIQRYGQQLLRRHPDAVRAWHC